MFNLKRILMNKTKLVFFVIIMCFAFILEISAEKKSSLKRTSAKFQREMLISSPKRSGEFVIPAKRGKVYFSTREIWIPAKK